jgi:hypothetical protein
LRFLRSSFKSIYTRHAHLKKPKSLLKNKKNKKTKNTKKKTEMRFQRSLALFYLLVALLTTTTSAKPLVTDIMEAAAEALELAMKQLKPIEKETPIQKGDAGETSGETTAINVEASSETSEQHNVDISSVTTPALSSTSQALSQSSSQATSQALSQSTSQATSQATSQSTSTTAEPV